METETDISEPSSKIIWMSEWAMGVAQVIQDHAGAVRLKAEEENDMACSGEFGRRGIKEGESRRKAKWEITR